MGSYGLLDFVFVFRSTSKVSWSLIESHWVSWFNDCQSWGVGAIFEHLRVWSTPCVSAPCWVGSSSLGHPRHAYVTVVWSCAVPMCRLCCLRCAFEWNGRRMSTACALLKHWRCGQVEVATVYGPVWNLGSQKILVSELQMVSVSDGFFVFWQCSYLSDRSCRMPRFGTVELGAVCDGLGRLWFFVLQWWEEIRRGRGGLAPCSVCFVCSRSAEASYKRWLCPFVSPDPKWEAFRGRRVARASCLKRRRVLVGWSFIQVLQQGFVSVILDRIFSEVRGVTVCLVFSCAFDAWEMWALLTLYESMALLALRFQLTQLFRHGLGKIFCHGQINLKPIKFQRESWKTMEGHECQNTEVRIWIGHFFVHLDASTNAFRGRHKCSSTMLSTSCRGGPSEPLDRWRMHRTPNVALGAEPVGPSRPIANELGKEAARWKPPCLLHDGTVVQQLNIEPFMV